LYEYVKAPCRSRAFHHIIADGAEVTVHSIHDVAVSQPPNEMHLINTLALLLLLLSLLLLLPLLLLPLLLLPAIHAVSIHPASSAA
jgi:hypothetical protein